MLIFGSELILGVLIFGGAYFRNSTVYVNYKEGGLPCERLCNVYYIYLKMYMKLRQESFTDMDLVELQVNIDN